METREILWKSLGGRYDEEDVQAVADVMRDQDAHREPERPSQAELSFEEGFAEHEGAEYASAVNSGSTGLDLAMRILGIGPGDEVITTPLTFVATPHSIAGTGAKVVFADIDQLTYNLDPLAAEDRITSRTKAIVPVHLNGMPADIDAFDELAALHGVDIVYDAAHAVGTLYKGAKIGPAGATSVYSFESGSNMSTLGEGGALTTDDAEYHERLQRIKNHGLMYGDMMDVVEWGSNFRMSDAQAAVGLTQLQKVDEVNRVRHRYAHHISEQLNDVAELIAPYDDGTHFCPYPTYMLRLDDEALDVVREDFLHLLSSRYRVGARILYRPLWDYSYYREMGCGPEETPIAARVLRQVFAVPLFPTMSTEEIDYVIWALKESLADLG